MNCQTCNKQIGGKKDADGFEIQEPCFPAPGGQWVDGEWTAGYVCNSCHERKAINDNCKKPRIPGPADAPCALRDGHDGLCKPYRMVPRILIDEDEQESERNAKP